MKTNKPFRINILLLRQPLKIESKNILYMLAFSDNSCLLLIHSIKRELTNIAAGWDSGIVTHLCDTKSACSCTEFSRRKI